MRIFLTDKQKTSEDVEVEGNIIKEMMEIVAKRDSLIALLEEDRLRCFLKHKKLSEDILRLRVFLEYNILKKSFFLSSFPFSAYFFNI